MEEIEESPYASARSVIRLMSQGIGAVLMIFGTAIALQILFKALKVLDNPDAMSGQIEAFQKALNCSEVIIQAAGGSYDVGRILAAAAVVVWMSLCVWISLSLIHAGARLVTWNLDERQLRSIAQSLVKTRETPKS